MSYLIKRKNKDAEDIVGDKYGEAYSFSNSEAAEFMVRRLREKYNNAIFTVVEMERRYIRSIWRAF